MTQRTGVYRGDMDWHDALALTPLDGRRFRAEVGDAWSSLQGAHGGAVAALALAAVEHVLTAEGVGSTTTMRAATLGYAAGNNVGEVAVDVDVVRRGRAMVTTHATVRQGERITTVARFHHSTPWEGLQYSDAPPMPERPANTIELALGRGSHLDQVETHLHPDTTMFGGAVRAEWFAWSRPRHGGTFDATWLTMFGDYFPPAVFTRVTDHRRAVTIEYSIQVHSAAGSWTIADDEYLAVRMHTFHSHDGFAVEDGWIWLPDGTLLATTRQTRLAG